MARLKIDVSMVLFRAKPRLGSFMASGVASAV
jgi:hypothetical protein